MEAIARSIPEGYWGIGDDVAVAPARGGKVVLKVDMLVEGTDMPPGMTYRQAGRKAVAMCVSDFAAKGVRPDSFLVSLGLRRGVTEEQVEDLARGLRDAENQWGVRLVGGDTNEAKELVVDCAMVGFAKRVVPRSGARPGDLVVVSGLFGRQPSGLRILLGGAKSEKRFAASAKKAVLQPAPDLELGLAVGKYLTSAMDSSDGLARSLHTLAGASKVGFELDWLPEAEGVRLFAKENGLDVEQLVVAGGEEYVIVGTVRSNRLQAAQRAAARVKGRLHVIGKTTAASGRVELKVGRSKKPIPDEGWTHLG